MGLINRKVKICVLTILFSSILISSTTIQKAEAWGPVSHLMLVTEAIDRAKQINPNSEILRIITANQMYFYCGFMFPDVTVIEYYTEFQSYQDTHMLAFYDMLWTFAESKASDEAKAFTIGIGTHLLQDSFIHNYYIPTKIRSTLITNNIIHPVTEAVIESKYINQNATAQAIAAAAFTAWNKPFDDFTYTDEQGTRYISPVEFVKIALGRDYTEQARSFEALLSPSGGGFYSEEGYWVPGGMAGFWGLYQAFAGVLMNFLSVEDYQTYKETTLQKTAEWYASGQASKQGLNTYMESLNPTGIDALNEANAYVAQWFVFMMVLSVVIGAIYVKRKRG